MKLSNMPTVCIIWSLHVPLAAIVGCTYVINKAKEAIIIVSYPAGLKRKFRLGTLGNILGLQLAVRLRIEYNTHSRYIQTCN